MNDPSVIVYARALAKNIHRRLLLGYIFPFQSAMTEGFVRLNYQHKTPLKEYNGEIANVRDDQCHYCCRELAMSSFFSVCSSFQ